MFSSGSRRAKRSRLAATAFQRRSAVASVLLELCGVISTLGNSWKGRRDGLRFGFFFLFDLLHLDGEALAPMPVTERKERLRALLSNAGSPLHFSDHQIGRGRAFYDHACTLGAG